MGKDHKAEAGRRAAKAAAKAAARKAHAPKKAAAAKQRGWQTKAEQKMTGGISDDLKVL